MADSILKLKYGSQAQYDSLTTKDENTLYFIINADKKNGKIYKGTDLMTYSLQNASYTTSGSGTAEILNITITNNYGDTSFSVSVPSAAALSAVQTALTNHTSKKATDTVLAHVKLSDATNNTTNTAASGNGIAATPKAVSDALTAAKQYADNLLGANDAMVFKGTIGTGGTVTALPTTGYSAGWTYRVITAGTYAGQKCEVGDLIIAVKDYATSTSNSDWTVAQTNIDGAVTSAVTLTTNQLVVGNNSKAVKILAAGANGKILKMVNGNPAWADETIGQNTTYTFSDGTQGEFTVQPSGGTAQTVETIGATALNVQHGGTGAKTFTSGNALIGNGTGAFSTKPINTQVNNDTNLITSGAVYNQLLWTPMGGVA